MNDYQTMKVSKDSGGAIFALTRKAAQIVFLMLKKEMFNQEFIEKAMVA